MDVVASAMVSTSDMPTNPELKYSIERKLRKQKPVVANRRTIIEYSSSSEDFGVQKH
jgi:hypothetical protein